MEGDLEMTTEKEPAQDFNPLPPHGGRLNGRGFRITLICISIHSLRMEGDYAGFSGSTLPEISIHSLRMEGDSRTAFVDVFTLESQSTPSAWRETFAVFTTAIFYAHFNPLPPHGGRLYEIGR